MSYPIPQTGDLRRLHKCKRSGLGSLFRRTAPAFSLVELLVVMGVLLLLVAVVTPPLGSALSSMSVSDAGNRVASSIEFGRTHATTMQTAVAVRFYLEEETPSLCRKMRLFEIRMEQGGRVEVPLSRTERLRSPAVISPEHSSAFAQGVMTEGAESSGQKFKEFYIFSDGSNSLPGALSPRPNICILPEQQAEETEPSNPFVLSIDPLTTRVSIFRRE